MGFNAAQQQAIDFGKGNALVSAGAGSGKTAVLTQRVYRLIEEGMKQNPPKEDVVDHLLVLTFTNKAAFEMKERVKNLVKQGGYESLLPRIEQSKIMTFDAFALDLVKRHHYLLGIDKEVQVVDQNVLLVQKRRTLDKILAKRYEEAWAGLDLAFDDLISSYCVKNDDNLVDFLIRFDEIADLQMDRDGYLSSYCDKKYSNEQIQSGIQMIYQRAKSMLESAYHHALNYEDGELSDSDCPFFEEALRCPDYDSLYQYLLTNKFPAKKKNCGTELDATIRDKFVTKLYKKVWGSQSDNGFLRQLGDGETLKQEYLSTEKAMRTCVEIVTELGKKTRAFLSHHAVYSFADIASLARKIVAIPEINQSLREQFDYIMIDEYQDTSDLQEALIGSLAKDNVFCVGDIKQSIYRFRNANPAIFSKKLSAYSKNQGGRLITLDANYRSRKEIIDTVNNIFGKIMSEEVGGVDYAKGQALSYGNANYLATSKFENYGIQTYAFEEAEGEERSACEAKIIALDIQKKIEEGYLVADFAHFDSDGNYLPRKVTYGDFAILIRRKKDFPIYQQMFNDMGIPLEVADTLESKQEDVIIVLRNYLRLVEKLSLSPSSKVIPLLFSSLARSFLFQMRDDELCEVLKDGRYKEVDFFKKIALKADELSQGSIEDALVYFIEEFDVIDALPRLGDVKLNYERIEAFLSLARSGALLRWNISDFVSFFEDLKRYDIDFDIPAISEEKNSVRLMSIHASKGLQFPVVYFPDLDSDFTRSKNQGLFAVSPDFGAMLPTEKGKMTLFHFLDSARQEQENRSEQLRLLYVALTRVREDMILLFPVKDKESEVDPLPSSSKTFHDFLIASSCLKEPELIMGYQDKESTPMPETDILESKTVEFRSVYAPSSRENLPRPSKELKEPIDQGVLVYGNHLHRLMEVVDFSTKDVSFIENERERALIKKVLSLPLFDESSKTKAYQEYEFLDEDGRRGVIDLFLVYDDHIDLVDYKSSNIDDPLYEKQLAVYEHYLASAFGLEIHKYLLSLSQARLKRVN